MPAKSFSQPKQDSRGRNPVETGKPEPKRGLPPAGKQRSLAANAGYKKEVRPVGLGPTGKSSAIPQTVFVATLR